MFYNLIRTPAVVKTGSKIIPKLDSILEENHLFFPKKYLITQQFLLDTYGDILSTVDFSKTLIVRGGTFEEAPELLAGLDDRDALLVAFGGGSVLDLVKYCAEKKALPYINLPSALSNDAVFSCVARLSKNGRKQSYGVQPPVGIIVDFDIIRKSPKFMTLAGIADIVSNLSACEDWILSNSDTGEPINEIALMLAKEAALPLFDYSEEDIASNRFLFDLTNGIVTSGLSTIVSGNTRGVSGAEHLISHAIDEYFPEKSTIHGLQVGWAHWFIENNIRDNGFERNRINNFFSRMGILRLFEEKIPWTADDFYMLIPYARKIRNRYTILNKIEL